MSIGEKRTINIIDKENIMNIINLLDKSNVTNSESYFQDKCESCNTSFTFGDSIHTIRNNSEDNPMSIICDSCFTVTTDCIPHNSLCIRTSSDE